MAFDLAEDTRTVRDEFDAISTPTQVFIAVLVALGILLGFVLGTALAVEELDANCIEWDDNVYCLDAAAGEGEEAGNDQ